MVNEGFHNGGPAETQSGGFMNLPPTLGNPQRGQHEAQGQSAGAVPAMPASSASPPSPRHAATATAAPRKERKEKKTGKPRTSSKGVSPETVGAILDAAGKVSRLEGSDAAILRELMGLPDNTAENKLIATFISKKNRTQALKRVDDELEILNSIRQSQQAGSVDFDTVFTIIGLGHDNRLERWTMASKFDVEAAKSVAGTEDGKCPRSWGKSSEDESKGLYNLYLRILEPYTKKMEWFKRIFA